MAKEADINERIRNLRDELRIAQEEYVHSNSPIPVGTKVKVNKSIGILIGYEFKYGEVKPVIAKIKKDGTPHASARIYCFWNENPEIIE